MDTIRALILSPLLGGPAYLAFASLLVGCSIGFPFSSDVTLITGGVLAGTGVFDLRATIFLAIASILLGDSLAFYAGRKFGHRIVHHRYFQKICPPARFEEISEFLKQNASKFIFMVRFTPGMRSAIFLTAGTVGVPATTFFKMNFLSTVLYVPILISLSFLASNNAEKLVAQFEAYNHIITIVIVVLIAAFIYRRQTRRARREK